jgi:Flp pilus assembly pilin Flp
MRENKGWVTIEYILFMGLFVVIVAYGASIVSDLNELNTAMTAAFNGASQGATVDSLAVYPEQSFTDYQKDNPRLLFPSQLKILKIDYKNQGYNASYKRIKIQLRVYVSGASIKNSDDRNCLGDRINFNMRRSITITFNSQNLTNTYYNPAFSNKYVFTTAEVNWI